MKRVAILCLCLGGFTGLPALADAPALDFAAAYREALANDATFAAARSAQQAGRYYVPQARAGLLPAIQLAGSTARNQAENTTPDIYGNPATSDIDYTSRSHQLSLRQPLWRPASVAQYRLAHAQEAYSEATFSKEWQALVDRLAQAYLDTLLAEQARELARVQKEALVGQLEQAQRFFTAGEGTRTDIDEAQARHDLAESRLIEAEYAVEIARRGLQELLGRQPGPLTRLRDTVPLTLPDGPNGADAWVELALEHSPELAAQRANAEAAQREAEKARAGHHPTLDLIAGRNLSESDTNNTIGSRYDTTYIGVQYTLPIYGGGSVSAGIQIALANQEKARQQQEAAARALATQVRKAYTGVVSSAARIRALAQAVRSAENLLESTSRGFRAGVRTQIDILNAIDQHYTAQRDHLTVRHEFARNWLLLQLHTGTLDGARLESFSRWFEAGTGTLPRQAAQP